MYSIEHYFGDAPVEWVTVEFWKPFFEGEHEDVDAFLMPAEHASGWTLLHPEYTVVVPQSDPIEVASAFGTRSANTMLAEIVNEWVVFADNTGEIDHLYDYWVLGQGAGGRDRRWSIIRDVLHLGDDPARTDTP